MGAPSIESADFRVEATLHQLLPGFAPVTVEAAGTLTDGGQQMLFDVDASTTTPGMDDLTRLKAAVAVGGEHDAYVRLDVIQGAVLEAILGADAMSAWIGKWWKLPAEDAGAFPPITPDPSLLRLQAEVLSVVKDLGIVAMDGFDTYHYEVRVDPAKLRTYLQAVLEARGEPVDEALLDEQSKTIDGSGEVWIDADTFYLRRVRWSLKDAAKQDGFTAEIDAHLEHFNAAKQIELPLGAEPFPLDVDQLLPEQTP